jgi:hypothetical protein
MRPLHIVRLIFVESDSDVRDSLSRDGEQQRDGEGYANQRQASKWH